MLVTKCLLDTMHLDRGGPLATAATISNIKQTSLSMVLNGGGQHFSAPRDNMHMSIVTHLILLAGMSIFMCSVMKL